MIISTQLHSLVICRFFRSKSPHLTPLAVRNPPSLYASQPKKLIDGSLFIRLNEFKRTSKDPRDLPPLIELQAGRALSEADVQKAQELYRSNPKVWTVSRLAHRFRAPYKFICDNVLSDADKAALKMEEQDKFVNLSLHKLKGMMVRERIRLDRLKSF